MRIDTTTKYKDSIHGIVPDTDDTLAYRPPTAEAATGFQDGAEYSLSEHSDEEEENVKCRANKVCDA